MPIVYILVSDPFLQTSFYQGMPRIDGLFIPFPQTECRDHS